MDVLIEEHTVNGQAATGTGAGAGAGTGTGAGPDEATVRDWLVDWLADRLGLAATDVPTDQPLAGLGLTSRGVVELSGALEELLDRALSPALLYEAPTVEALARRLTRPDGQAAAGAPASVASPAPTAAEPVAVIGLGLRLPGGAADPDGFWDLLAHGRDAIGEAPPGRWELLGALDPAARAVLDRTPSRGGYLTDDPAAFDPAFFGMSDREAAATDPQQRLMLEVAWQALEHAGIPPRSLARTRTGVFVGASVSDYGAAQMAELSGIDAWTGAGSALAVIANRVSYTLGLRGPSLVVDTACSSSLVAVHQAVQSLRSGESELALAGGVNLLLSPSVTVNFEEAGVMAADGRCKTFAADADGYGRAEGCGVVVLKTLSAARRDGDRVLAVLSGSAVNQDGASNGLLAPNPEAQQELLRTALAAAGLTGPDVDYVEAHGTGTALGDPVEASALAAVLLDGRDRDLLIGSVKTNLGHLEAAAGVAGLIKVVLALGRDTLPASLHFDRPNPLIPFDRLPLRVVTAATPWPRTDRPRRAGVSSFGFGGTNAHVIVEESPDPAPPSAPSGPEAPEGAGVHLVPVSAGSPEALAERLRRLTDWLAGPGADVPLPDLAHTLAVRRPHEPQRLAVPARDARELRRALADHLAGAAVPGLAVSGPAAPGPAQGRAGAPAGPVWLFSGQGSQWAGMGRALYDTAPAFRRAVEELEPLVAAESGFSLHAVLRADTVPAEVSVVQPLIFAVQLGLAALWRAHGVRPAAVVGHSMGEVAAAVVAGALGVEDAARVVCRRSRLLLKVAGRGAMAVVESPAEEVAARLARTVPDGSVTVAVVPGDHSTVVAGDPAGIDALRDAYAADGIDTRPVQVDVASHSPQMDDLLPLLRAELDGLTPRRPELPFFSTVAGRLGTEPACDAAYWCDNLRAPVHFAAAVRAARQAGYGVFVELSGHPVLTRDTAATLDGEGGVLVTGTLLRDRDPYRSFLAALGRLYCHGLAPDWRRFTPGGPPTDPPGMAWRRTRHWTTVRAALPAPAPAPVAELPAGVPEGPLGPVTTPAAWPGTRLWQPAPDRPALRPLREHLLYGAELVPLAGYAWLALTAAREAGLAAPEVRDLTVHQPLVLDGAVRALQLTLRPAEDGTAPAAFDVHSQDAEGHWHRHASARVHEDPYALDLDVTDPDATDPSAVGRGEPLDAAAHYTALAAAGLVHGPALRALGALRSRPGAVLADALPGLPADGVAALDAAFQALPAALPPGGTGGTGGWTVVGLDGLAVRPDRVTGPLTVRARVTGDPDGPALLAELDWYRGGSAVARARGVRVRRVDTGPVRVPAGWLHTVEWRPAPLTADTPAGRADGTPEGPVLLVGGGAVADALAALLRDRGTDCRTTDCRTTDGRIADGQSTDGQITDALTDDVRHVVHLPVPGGPAPDAAVRLTADAARLVRAVAGAGRARLWIVTTHAQQPGSDTPLDPAHAALWGLGRSAALEHPDAWGGLVDLAAPAGPEDAVRAARALAAELAAAPGTGTQSAHRAGTRYAPRLAARPDAARGAAVRLDPDGSHLVVGATGRTGPAVLDRLAALGARHLVLVSRRGAAGAAGPVAATLERLRAAGVTVHEVAADVTDEAAMRALFARFGTGLPPLRGVVQAAFAEDVAPIAELTPERVAAVLRPKVHGTDVLHRLTADHPVEHFVCFSSTTGLLGSQGLAHYAAASCWLDALVQERHRAGRPALAVAWGPWRDGLDAALHPPITATGMRLMTGATAAAALDRALAGGRTQLVVADADWSAVAAAYGLRTPVPLLADHHAPDPDSGPDLNPHPAAPAEQDVLALLEAAPTAQRRREIVVGHVQAAVARALAIDPPQALDPDADYHAFGLDSLMSMTVLRRLKVLAPGLKPSAVSLHRTVAELADAVLRHRDSTATATDG
ncbi:SDR family NAD(P)-dependent oxidoreductase [Kitasatospora sp. NPDC096077]|uniref:SDR family NAD(P)-dependent oxidoreductase n=1 Tax=Kitasatospora sp. NPDC096077 TaxID=3155544 RepID=UPI00333457DC